MNVVSSRGRSLAGTVAGAMAIGFCLAGATSASAVAWPPAAPVVDDQCGASQDGFTLPPDDGQDISWRDTAGNYYVSGRRNSTLGAGSVTLIAKRWDVSGPSSEHTFAPMTFGVEPDSTCAEAPDTVTTSVGACNTSQGNSGTRVTFTYTNTDDATNWAHTRPAIWVNRWDHGQSAYVVPTQGRVEDGQQASITGGDATQYNGNLSDFFIAPGTYTMKLSTKEYGERLLPNTFFVPACGDHIVPPGDPSGLGGARASATLVKAKCATVKIRLDNRAVLWSSRFHVSVRGKTKRVLSRDLASGKSAVVKLKVRDARKVKVSVQTFRVSTGAYTVLRKKIPQKC